MQQKLLAKLMVFLNLLLSIMTNLIVSRRPWAMCFLSCCFVAQTALAQHSLLKTTLKQLTQPLEATVGVAVMHLGSQDTLTLHGAGRYPMQSVFKFPLAMAVLHQVDQGKLSLNQPVHLTQADMMQNTWSPLAKKYPQGGVDLPLRDILTYTVAESDNSGCDVLFKLVGGPRAVQQYIHGLGVKDIAIVATEREMHQDWETQFTNWAQPMALVELLYLAFETGALSESSRTFLWKTMAASVPGAHRIKGALPEGTVVAHKTGTGGTDEAGLQSASNDVGVVTLPNGQQFALAVLVAHSKETSDTNEAIIAQIARAVYDHYATQGR